MLNAADYQLFQELRKKGVFEPIQSRFLEGKSFQCVVCSDGHRFQDAHSHLASVGCEKPDCVHTTALNGAPFAADSSSPIFQYESDGVSIPLGQMVAANILGGIKLAKGTVVANLGHWPCGMCGAHEISFENALQILNRSSTALGMLPGVSRVHTLMHFDLKEQRPERFRTYYFHFSRMAERIAA